MLLKRRWVVSGDSLGSQWRDIPASGDLGVLRGSTSSIARLHLSPYSRAALGRRSFSYRWRRPRFRKRRQRGICTHSILDREGPPRLVFLPIRIEARQLRLDVESSMYSLRLGNRNKTS